MIVAAGGGGSAGAARRAHVFAEFSGAGSLVRRRVVPACCATSARLSVRLVCSMYAIHRTKKKFFCFSSW